MPSVLGFSVQAWGSPLIGSYKVPGTNVTLTVRKEVAPILIGFARDFNATVEPLRSGWCWGFNPKHIEGSSNWSNHAWGGAIDLNAPAHPMGKANTYSVGERAAIDKLLKKYSYKGTRLLRAGKDYNGRKDDMHFEINVTRAVALAAVAAMSSSATIKPGSRSIAKGDRGADVTFMQGKVGAKADGIFGPDTEAKLKSWQRAKKLTPDGVCGPKTWAAMGVK